MKISVIPIPQVLARMSKTLVLRWGVSPCNNSISTPNEKAYENIMVYCFFLSFLGISSHKIKASIA